MATINLYETSSSQTPFAKLSPLYKFVPLITIKNKFSSLDPMQTNDPAKSKNLTNSVLSYIYAGIVKHKSTREELLTTYPHDVKKQALASLEKEIDEVFLKSVKKAVDYTLQTKPLVRKALLRTGLRRIMYKSNVNVLNENNVMGDDLSLKRNIIRAYEKEKIGKEQSQKEQDDITIAYQVYDVLKERYSQGGMIDIYLYQSPREILKKLGIPKIVGNVDINSVNKDLKKILANPLYCYLIPSIIKARFAKEHNQKVTEHNKRAILNRFIEKTVSSLNEAKKSEHRKNFFKNIDVVDELENRLYFMWENGILTLKDLPNPSDNRKFEILPIVNEEFNETDSFDLIANQVEKEFIQYIASKTQKTSEEMLKMLKNKSLYLPELLTTLKKELLKEQNTVQVTIDDVNCLEGNQHVLTINESNTEDPLSLSHPTYESDSGQLFDSILHFAISNVLRYLGSKIENIELKNIPIEQCFDILGQEQNKYIQRTLLERLKDVIKNIYNTSNTSNELSRLLVSTSPSQLVYNDPSDSFLGTGKDGNGLNVIGIEMMNQRQELMKIVQPYTKGQLEMMIEPEITLDMLVQPSEKEWLLQQVDDLLRGIKLFHTYSIICHRRLYQSKLLINIDEKDVDFIISLYIGCFGSLIDDVSIKKTEVPHDFVKYVRKNSQGITLSISSIQLIWQYTRILQHMMKSLNLTSISSETLKKYSSYNRQITSQIIDTSYKTHISHDQSFKTKQTILDSFLSVFNRLKKYAYQYPVHKDDFAFIYRLLSTQKVVDDHHDRHAEYQDPFIQTVRSALRSDPILYDHIVKYEHDFMGFIEHLSQQQNISSRALFFKCSDKKTEKKKEKPVVDEPIFVRDEEDNQDNGNDLDNPLLGLDEDHEFRELPEEEEYDVDEDRDEGDEGDEGDAFEEAEYVGEFDNDD